MGPRRKYNKSDPTSKELVFQTRHLRRDLHAKLHIVKAARNAKRLKTAPPVTIDQVLNEALDKGLAAINAEEGASWTLAS